MGFDTGYQREILATRPDERELLRQRGESEHFPLTPVISLITPVYETAPDILRMAIRSIRAQSYPYWQLCLANDGSVQSHIRPMLDRYAAADPRISVIHRSDNGGISAASNDALAMATGEFIALFDHDDTIEPHALYRVAQVVNEHPAADVLYAEYDVISKEGRRTQPFRKPGWSPELMWSMPYLTHLVVHRRALVDRVGGFRSEYDGAQDWDLGLRIAELTDRIHHIPEVLYHWRTTPASVLSGLENKPYAMRAQARALAAAFARTDVAAWHEPGLLPAMYRVRFSIPSSASVDVVIGIPTSEPGQIADWVRLALDLSHGAEFRRHRLVLLVDEGDIEAAEKILEGLGQSRVVVIGCAPWSSFAERATRIALSTAATYLTFLERPLIPSSPGWLEALLEPLQRAGVGACGAKLYGSNGTIAEAGIAWGPRGPWRPFRGEPAVSSGETNLLGAMRTVTAVSASCLATTSGAFRRLGGFRDDATSGFPDLDFCLRLREHGLRVAWTPHATLAFPEIEGTCRSALVRARTERFAEVWGSGPARDPHVTRAMHPNDGYVAADVSA
jgi:GT2 family glycosyltransferase